MITSIICIGKTSNPETAMLQGLSRTQAIADASLHAKKCY